MAARAEGPHAEGLLGTHRKDNWWVSPLLVAIGFTAFIIYSTWAAYVGRNFEVLPEAANSVGNHLLSPFYSPCLGQGCSGPFVIPFLENIPISAAFWILWAPLGFRATCYYYRKAYYRAYFLSPAACSVEKGDRGYQGERAFPFILQNLHRYFLPFALLLVLFLSYDALLAFNFKEAGDALIGAGNTGFGVSVGTLVLTANVVFLAGYTFGCHSLRHVIGGRLDCLTCPRGPSLAHEGWKGVSWFNGRHMFWAWVSLFWVGFTDLYVRLVASGIITDVRLI